MVLPKVGFRGDLADNMKCLYLSLKFSLTALLGEQFCYFKKKLNIFISFSLFLPPTYTLPTLQLYSAIGVGVFSALG